MTIPRVYKTEVIILKRTNLGEADRILTLYTPYLGKFKAVAKGVRRPASKLGGHVELLTRSQMMLARGRNLDIVTQSQTLESFLPLRENLWRVSHAFYIAELVDGFTADRIECYPLYQLLLSSLRWLSESRQSEVAFRYFELHLLDDVGYRPQLGQCLGCKGALEAVMNLFSSSDGGVFCPRCGQETPLAQALSPDTLKVLRFLQDCDVSTARRLKLSKGTASEAERLMRGYIRYLLEREVRSVGFLDVLRHEGSKTVTA